MILSRDRVSPDPLKIEALKRLPEPKDEKLLQSFLGIVNYLSRFDPNIANMTHNLRELLKKGSDPKWTDMHVSVQIMEMLCGFGSAFIVVCAGYMQRWGMYKCSALCWVSMDMQLWCCSLATVGSSGLDLDSRGLDIGPIDPSY